MDAASWVAQPCIFVAILLILKWSFSEGLLSFRPNLIWQCKQRLIVDLLLSTAKRVQVMVQPWGIQD